MRRTHKVGRVKLVLVQEVVSKGLNHVGHKADFANQVERHVLFEILAVKDFTQMLSVRIVSLLALLAFNLVINACVDGS